MKPKRRVILYTKSNCGLCEKMKEQMAMANCAELYTLEEVDIEKDSELSERYRYEIPVLFIDEIGVFRHRLKADDFRAHITSLDDGQA